MRNKIYELMPHLDKVETEKLIEEINELKKSLNAVVLCHNYQTPDIYFGVADIVGDSLYLAQQASKVSADIIVMAGVHFMAETAKLMNPQKTVLIPDLKAGCSLAESITARDVQLLKEKYPGVPVVTYVNTSAEVKAESDVCCTSGNALEIVENLKSDTVLMIPDEYLANWVASQTTKKIITWKGHCEVHEKFTPEEIRAWRDVHDGLIVLAHPECPDDVLREADFVGSTAKMSNYVKDKAPAKVLMVTECSMSDNLAVENPQTEFVRPCNLCPHMKTITLQKIKNSLTQGVNEVIIEPEIAERAKKSVERMFYV